MLKTPTRLSHSVRLTASRFARACLGRRHASPDLDEEREERERSSQTCGLDPFGTKRKVPEKRRGLFLTRAWRVMMLGAAVGLTFPAPAHAAGETFVFGDSLAVAIAPYVNGIVGGGVLVDAVVGRTTQEGVSIAANRQSDFSQADTIFLSLGANDGQNAGRYAAMLGQILDSIGPAPRVVLIGLANTKAFHSGVNAAMIDAADARPNVAYANWAGIADGSSGLLRSDGVHLTAGGASALASLAVDTLNGVAQPAPAAGAATSTSTTSLSVTTTTLAGTSTTVAGPTSTVISGVVDPTSTSQSRSATSVAAQGTDRASATDDAVAAATTDRPASGSASTSGSLPVLLRAIILGGFVTVGVGYLRNNPNRVRVRRHRRIARSEGRHPAQPPGRMRGALAPPLIRIDRRTGQGTDVDRHPAGRRQQAASTWKSAPSPADVGDQP